MHRYLCVGSLIVFVIAVICGCNAQSNGPELGQVEGRVMLDGKPLSDATVIFRPSLGRESRAITDADGHYTLQYTPGNNGAITGDHVVIISTRTEAHPKELVPLAYTTRGALTAKVQPGKNEIDFHLESKPKKVP